MRAAPCLPDRASLTTAPEREAYDRVVEGRRELGHEVSPYFAAVMNVPELAELLSRVGSFFRRSGRRECGLPDDVREVVAVAIAARLACRVTVLSHAPDALSYGVPVDVVEALVYGRQVPEPYGTYVGAAMSIIAGSLSEAEWATLEEKLGLPAAVEFCTFAGYVMFSCRNMVALAIPEPDDSDIQRLLTANQGA